MKVAVAGKGGVGKTTVSARLARELSAHRSPVLVVDCDPNPNLAESFGVDSAKLPRFGPEALRRAGETLELAHEPELVDVGRGVALLGGPPTEHPLADAVARGIAGVLMASRFAAVVTDLGAGPEFTRVAVGGALNPADLCIVVTTGAPSAELAADRIENACAERGVPVTRVAFEAHRVGEVVGDLARRLLRDAR